MTVRDRYLRLKRSHSGFMESPSPKTCALGTEMSSSAKRGMPRPRGSKPATKMANAGAACPACGRKPQAHACSLRGGLMALYRASLEPLEAS